MDPLKKIQVEGYAMFAEPELLFGNLDELCCVSVAFPSCFINQVFAISRAAIFEIGVCRNRLNYCDLRNFHIIVGIGCTFCLLPCNEPYSV